MSKSYHVQYLKDYQAPHFKITKTKLNFDLHDGYTNVTAILSISRADNNKDEPLVLAGEAMELVSLKLDGNTVSDYKVDETELRIESVPDNFELEVQTKICPEQNLTLSGLYRSNKTFCTQCEAHGFRRITYYLDRPDCLSEFYTRIEANKADCPILLSNGNLIDSGDSGDRHWVEWHDPFLKPSYLFALVAGDLGCYESQFVTCSNRTIDLKIYVEHGNESKCEHAMHSLKHAMRWDEEVYGREYDLDIFMIVAVSDFNMGAMENKGLNIFNDRYILADPRTATDQDYQAIEGVVAHEYFHNWTGNRVTCRDWFQLSLKEGLTVFRDQEFSRDMNSRVVNRIEDVARLKQFQFKEDSGPNAHPVQPDEYVEVNNFYTATVYEKGSELIRMLHTIVTPEGFRKGTDLYFERHDGQAVTIEDWVAAIADANQMDLSEFFTWYKQAGTPELTVKSEYNETNRTLKVHFSQHTPDTPKQTNKKPVVIPIRYGVVHPEYATQRDDLYILDKKEGSIELHDIAKGTVASVLRDFSAPVNLKYDIELEDWFTLLAYDHDGVNRYEASQFVYRKLLKLRYEGDFHWQSSWTDSFKTMLFDRSIDNAIKAKLLSFPSLSELLQYHDPIDVKRIYETKHDVKLQFVEAIREQLVHIIEEHPLETEADLGQTAMASRSLRNTALGLLAYRQDENLIEPLMHQLKHAATMTDQITALRCLLWFYPKERAAASNLFYQQWQDDHLVLDKWFGIHAMIPDENHLAAIKTLVKHPKFTLKNPNRLRSLISVYTNFNPLAFHEHNGASYEFIADIIKEVDAMNPQIAARLSVCLERWNKFVEPQKGLMKQAIESILSVSNLSKDTYEILSKAIA